MKLGEVLQEVKKNRTKRFTADSVLDNNVPCVTLHMNILGRIMMDSGQPYEIGYEEAIDETWRIVSSSDPDIISRGLDLIQEASGLRNRTLSERDVERCTILLEALKGLRDEGFLDEKSDD